MEKAIKINIGNEIFHIQEEAYLCLKEYIDHLTTYYSSYEEGVEIMNDIEQRVAEILKERGRSIENTANMSDIEYVISVLGKPEEIIGEEMLDDDQPRGSKTFKPGKRLLRDPDRIVFAGVSGGLGAYFGVDPVIFRILFVVSALAYSTGFWAYLVLWIAIPLARTRADKLEMRGQNVNVSNIDKSIKNEVENVKENFSKIRTSVKFNRFREMFDGLINFLGSSLTIVFKVAILIFGISIIIAAIIGLFAFLAFLVTGLGISQTVPEIISMYVSPNGTTSFLIIAMSLLVIIPLIALIYGGAKIAFKFKSNNKLIWLGILGVWVVALFVFMFNSMLVFKQFTVTNEITNEFVLKEFNNDTLFLDTKDHDIRILSKFGFVGGMKIGSINNKNLLIGRPELDVKKSSDENFRLVITKKSKGESMKKARINASKLNYNFFQKDSSLQFDTFFSLVENERWLAQDLNLTLYMPVGKIIFLGEKTGKIIYDIKNIQDTYDDDMLGHYWIMTDKGLSALYPKKIKYGLRYKKVVYFDNINDLENKIKSLKSQIVDVKKTTIRLKKSKFKYRNSKFSEKYKLLMGPFGSFPPLKVKVVVPNPAKSFTSSRVHISICCSSPSQFEYALKCPYQSMVVKFIAGWIRAVIIL